MIESRVPTSNQKEIKNYTMTSTSIRKILHNNSVCFIRFEKADGTIRNMICTLSMVNIPKKDHPRNTMTYTDDQIRVWDVVARSWRSMIVDRVIEVTPYSADVASNKA